MKDLTGKTASGRRTTLGSSLAYLTLAAFVMIAVGGAALAALS